MRTTIQNIKNGLRFESDSASGLNLPGHIGWHERVVFGVSALLEWQGMLKLFTLILLVQFLTSRVLGILTLIALIHRVKIVRFLIIFFITIHFFFGRIFFIQLLIIDFLGIVDVVSVDVFFVLNSFEARTDHHRELSALGSRRRRHSPLRHILIFLLLLLILTINLKAINCKFGLGDLDGHLSALEDLLGLLSLSF